MINNNIESNTVNKAHTAIKPKKAGNSMVAAKIPGSPCSLPTPSNEAGKRFQLSLEPQDLLNSLILGEVLGKPKCMRKGR